MVIDYTLVHTTHEHKVSIDLERIGFSEDVSQAL
jgi:hypothetical protein